MTTEPNTDDAAAPSMDLSGAELDTILRERICALPGSLSDAFPTDAQILALAAVVVFATPGNSFGTTHIVAGDSFMIRAGLAEAARLGNIETTRYDHG